MGISPESRLHRTNCNKISSRKHSGNFFSFDRAESNSNVTDAMMLCSSLTDLSKNALISTFHSFRMAASHYFGRFYENINFKSENCCSGILVFDKFRKTVETESFKSINCKSVHANQHFFVYNFQTIHKLFFFQV